MSNIPAYLVDVLGCTTEDGVSFLIPHEDPGNGVVPLFYVVNGCSVTFNGKDKPRIKIDADRHQRWCEALAAGGVSVRVAHVGPWLAVLLDDDSEIRLVDDQVMTVPELVAELRDQKLFIRE